MSEHTPGKGERSGAVISDCGRYRYVLTRHWLRGEGSVAFVMLNPSTADATIDDPTIRRCMGFAQRWGFGSLSVVNLYGLRATDPSALADADDPIGPDNDDWLHETGWTADEVVLAWGAHRFAVKREREAVELLSRGRGERLKCLGLSANGHPRHPLYLRGDAERFAYPRGEQSR